MNKSVHRRIFTLQSAVVSDCETCRFWYGTVLRDDAGNRSRPESCPACGRIVAITHYLHIVGVPLNLL
jgi:hypothetical protein